MKKIYTTMILSALCIFAIHAQPIITASFIPVVNDVMTSQGADTTGITEGNTGASMTWNFSTLIPTGSVQTSTYISPAGTTYASNFPTATLATSSAAGIIYFMADTTSFYMVGVGTPSFIMTYSSPLKLFQFPMTYNSTFTSTSNIHYFVNSTDVYRRGTLTSLVDGYGTLNIPGGTYTNVLRTKVVQTYNDSFVYSGTTLGTGVATTTTYYWINATSKNQLLAISVTNSNEMGNISASKTVSYYPLGSTGIREENRNISSVDIYPNPANDKATLSFTMKGNSIVKAEITDIAGRNFSVQNFGELNTGGQQIELNCAELRSGLYFVKLYDHSGQATSCKLQVIK